jgi:hypothetical protein
LPKRRRTKRLPAWAAAWVAAWVAWAAWTCKVRRLKQPASSKKEKARGESRGLFSWAGDTAPFFDGQSAVRWIGHERPIRKNQPFAQLTRLPGLPLAHLTLSASFGVDNSAMRGYFPDLSPVC